MVVSLKILYTKLPRRLSKKEQYARTTFPELLRDSKAKLSESKKWYNLRRGFARRLRTHS